MGSLQLHHLWTLIRWLGISVWAFTSICESSWGKPSTLKREYRLDKGTGVVRGKKDV
ncbi:hypothetical protein AVEN_211383-1, partial [Araneus ventricosus]